MRLNEFNNLTEIEGEQGTSLSEKEFDFIHDLVKDDVLRNNELRDVIKSALVDYPRNKNSLRNAALRMYVIVHGELPLDAIDSADWYKVPNTIRRYAQAKGYDVDLSTSYAQENAARRVNHDEAMQTMQSFYTANKANIDKGVSASRDEIVDSIKNGHTPEEAFAPYMQTMESIFKDLESRLIECQKATSMLTENTKPFFELGDLLNAALLKYNAAKRGLGIANKLRNPGERAMHRSVIMGHLNRLRADVRRMEKLLNG